MPCCIPEIFILASCYPARAQTPSGNSPNPHSHKLTLTISEALKHIYSPSANTNTPPRSDNTPALPLCRQIEKSQSCTSFSLDWSFSKWEGKIANRGLHRLIPKADRKKIHEHIFRGKLSYPPGQPTNEIY